MQDLDEHLRRHMELIRSLLVRALPYWEKVPIHRAGDELCNRIEALIRSIIDGEGDVKKIAADAGSLCFLIGEKGPEIRAQLDRIKGARVTETTAEEHDPEREEWERKHRERKGGSPGSEDWRG